MNDADGIGPRARCAPLEDGGAHDVTILVEEETNAYQFRPNNERALAAMLTISPEGCEGMTVGSDSPVVPWMPAWFLSDALQRKYGLSVRERMIEE